MDDVVVLVRAHWRSQGLEPGSAASPEEIAGFEVSRGVRLPPDVRQYFEVLNGTANESMDREHIAFWPLDRVRSVADELGHQEEVLPVAHDFHCFADYSVWCNAYAVRLSATGSGPADVVAVYSGLDLIPVAGSLFEFLQKYVGPRADSVLHPQWEKNGRMDGAR